MKPTQTIQYLGVIVDSRKMTVTLTPERARNRRDIRASILKSNRITVRDLVKMIGKIVASFLAAKFGPSIFGTSTVESKRGL